MHPDTNEVERAHAGLQQLQSPFPLRLYRLGGDIQYPGNLFVLLAFHIHKKYSPHLWRQAVYLSVQQAAHLLLRKVIGVGYLLVGMAQRFDVIGFYILVLQIVEGGVAHGVIKVSPKGGKRKEGEPLLPNRDEEFLYDIFGHMDTPNEVHRIEHQGLVVLLVQDLEGGDVPSVYSGKKFLGFIHYTLKLYSYYRYLFLQRYSF